MSHLRWRPPVDGVPPRQASPRPRSRLAAPSPRSPEPRPPVAVRDRRPPGASNGFVRGVRLRGLVYDSHPPRPRSRHAPRATLSPHDPERRPPRASPGAVQWPCLRRPAARSRPRRFPPTEGVPRDLGRSGRPHPLPAPSLCCRERRPRGKFAAGVPGAVHRLCSPRVSVGLVRDVFLPRMAFPRSWCPSRPRSRRHGNISEQEIKQVQTYTTAAVTRVSPNGVLGGVGGQPFSHNALPVVTLVDGWALGSMPTPSGSARPSFSPDRLLWIWTVKSVGQRNAKNTS